MSLPPGILALHTNVTKNYTRPDNAFYSSSISDAIIHCEVAELLMPINMDHYPIIIEYVIIPELANTQSSITSKWLTGKVSTPSYDNNSSTPYTLNPSKQHKKPRSNLLNLTRQSKKPSKRLFLWPNHLSLPNSNGPTTWNWQQVTQKPCEISTGEMRHLWLPDPPRTQSYQKCLHKTSWTG